MKVMTNRNNHKKFIKKRKGENTVTNDRNN